MITTRQFQLLRHFFASYFHQDWTVEADTWQGVVTNYATQEADYAALPELHEAILAFIAEHPDENDLADKLLREMSCHFSPQALGLTATEWLRQVAAQVLEESKIDPKDRPWT